MSPGSPKPRTCTEPVRPKQSQCDVRNTEVMRALLARSKFASFCSAASWLALHYVMCYPASVSRGSPPLDAFWETWALITCYPGFVIYPFFDDDVRTRRIIRCAFIALASVGIGVALANVNSSRPRIGHLAGWFGVVYYESFDVCVYVTLASLAVFVAGWGTEWLATWFWSFLREFADTSSPRNSRRFVFNLQSTAIGVAVIGAEMAILGYAIRRWPL